jgi:hypothetical protein
MSLFDSMCAFARKTKTVRLADPGDIIREVKHWSPEDMDRPVRERGEPVRVELQIKPGAATMDFRVRSLTMAQREIAEAILDAAVPPATWIDEPGERPGQLAKRVPTGYDFDDPKYLAALRPLHERQAAFVALKGVDGLEEDTPGQTDADKTTALLEKMPAKMIKFLAAEIWNMTYAQGDPNDFFTKEGSAHSPSSAPSPSKSPAGKKPRS